MKTYIDCVPCFVTQSLVLVKKSRINEKQREECFRALLRIIAGTDMILPPPVLASRIHRYIRNYTDADDPYRMEKEKYNRLALSILPSLKKIVSLSRNPFEMAVRFSIAGNIIDFGKNAKLTETEVRRNIRRAASMPLDNAAVRELRKRTGKARRILFLFDNAGEIVLDRLLIDCIGPEKITGVVRGFPVINDATLEDAKQVSLTEIMEIIDNGSDAPGTVLPDCSRELRRRFAEADIIIAKGQGNYETLSGVKHPGLFFLLQAKCDVVARDLSCNPGDYIVRKGITGAHRK